MPQTQSNDSMPATLTNLDRPVTPTSPHYSPMDEEPVLSNEDWINLADLPAAKVREKTPEEEHACMSWTACFQDDCRVHEGAKRDHDYYPKHEHRTPPSSSPLSSASSMSWDNQDQPPPPTSPKASKALGKKKGRKAKTVQWADQKPQTTRKPFVKKARLEEEKYKLENEVQDLQRNLDKVVKDLEDTKKGAALIYLENNKLERKLHTIRQSLEREKAARREEKARVGWIMDDARKLHNRMTSDYYGAEWQRKRV